eukprot:CAMPEP_0114490098 /NCGR_PEP_ID=MMETSP0109-20121206/2250_1 /TAXON_ID=29199 /ORGANISM="Chlorarachnion reptans, Strain CCCM449" /LENGTH=127 /DNA_ID=CAMNT_0001666671 /DNA_START=540 /DNA_END=920 /DNA_ORIENTATION=-
MLARANARRTSSLQMPASVGRKAGCAWTARRTPVPSPADSLAPTAIRDQYGDHGGLCGHQQLPQGLFGHPVQILEVLEEVVVDRALSPVGEEAAQGAAEEHPLGEERPDGPKGAEPARLLAGTLASA